MSSRPAPKSLPHEGGESEWALDHLVLSVVLAMVGSFVTVVLLTCVVKGWTLSQLFYVFMSGK